MDPTPTPQILEHGTHQPPRKQGSAVRGILDVDWSKWVRAHPGTPFTLLSKVLETSGETASAASELVAALAGLTDEQRRAYVVERLASVVARVFGMAPGDLDAARGLKEYGLDSLMAVEMRVALDDAGFSVSTMELLSGRSIDELARQKFPDMAPVSAPAGGAV